MKAYINEIFTSIQGEGSLVGLPFIFVRFAECNLRCPYCDTKFSWEKTEFCNFNNERIKNPIPDGLLVDIISSLPFDYLAFTGGEPLLNQEVIEKIVAKINKKSFIETNGTLYEKLSQELLDKVSFWSVDLKLPSLVKQNLFELHLLFVDRLKKAKGEIIFKVIFSVNSTENEFNLVFNIVNNLYKNKDGVKLVFQPVTQNGSIEVDKKQLDIIYSIMKLAKFEVRLIPQIHKILKLP